MFVLVLLRVVEGNLAPEEILRDLVKGSCVFERNLVAVMVLAVGDY